jgi:AcrR family transcriptional regulator
LQVALAQATTNDRSRSLARILTVKFQASLPTQCISGAASRRLTQKMNQGSFNRIELKFILCGMRETILVYRQTERMAERLADRRTRILRAALDLVSEDGWTAAQIVIVAAKAGIATGTVYRYWPSKADLCAEIVATVSAHEVGVVKAIVEADEEPIEKLTAAIKAFSTRALRGRRLAYALIAEPVDPEVEVVRLEYRAQLAHCFERILREGMMRGVFPQIDPAVAAACIVGAFMEALIGPLAPSKGSGKRADQRLINQIADFCLRASIGSTEKSP